MRLSLFIPLLLAAPAFAQDAGVSLIAPAAIVEPVITSPVIVAPGANTIPALDDADTVIVDEIIEVPGAPDAPAAVEIVEPMEVKDLSLANPDMVDPSFEGQDFGDTAFFYPEAVQEDCPIRIDANNTTSVSGFSIIDAPCWAGKALDISFGEGPSTFVRLDEFGYSSFVFPVKNDVIYPIKVMENTLLTLEIPSEGARPIQYE